MLLRFYLFLILIPFTVVPQTGAVKFQRISIEKGLSNSVVTCIYKDKEGFMWFGTQDGLNKYDGYVFTIYKSIPFDSSSLADNWIQSITEDNSGNLWVGTYSGGLFKYNKQEETFVNFKNVPGMKNSLSNNRVWALSFDNSDGIWIGTSGGLDKFEIKEKTFSRFNTLGGKAFDPGREAVNSIYDDRNGVLWLGTWGSGLINYNKKKNIFTRYNFNKQKKSGFDYIKTIYADGNILWLGTSSGLLRFEINKKTFKYFALNANKNSAILNSVLSINKDNNGVLWIGTHNEGLYKLNINTGKYFNYQHNALNPRSISDNWISAVYRDENDLFWIGSGRGVNKILPYSKYFLHFANNPTDPNSLSANEVNTVFEDSEGTVWLGT